MTVRMDATSPTPRREVVVGDCTETLAALEPESFDSVVCDPPYGIGVLGHEWDSPDRARSRRDCAEEASGGSSDPADERASGEGPSGSRAFQRWCEQWGREALRVLKPGGHALVFGSTRSGHRMVSGLEDAGFVPRDTIHWTYGNGMPKGLNISLAFDEDERRRRERAARTALTAAGYPHTVWWDDLPGDVRPVAAAAGVLADGPPPTATRPPTGDAAGDGTRPSVWRKPQWVAEADRRMPDGQTGPPISDDAVLWDGWFSVLKPSHELVLVARKPLADALHRNVAVHGTGALNIDGCRVPHAGAADLAESTGKNLHSRYAAAGQRRADLYSGDFPPARDYDGTAGRYAPNTVLTHAAQCVRTGSGTVRTGTAVCRNSDGTRAQRVTTSPSKVVKIDQGYADTDGLERIDVWDCAPSCPAAALDGSASEGDRPSRFFPTFAWDPDLDAVPPVRYVAKPRSDERDAGIPDGTANTHPAVKPVALCRWLVRLVTPPGGRVLDPFSGSGTVGVAAVLEGLSYLGVDESPEYVAVGRHRIAYAEQVVSDGAAGRDYATVASARRSAEARRSEGQSPLF